MMSTQDIKYPDIDVQLTGEDGNAAGIISAVARALKRGGIKEGVVREFRREAMSGDYDNVLRTAMRWVDVR